MGKKDTGTSDIYNDIVELRERVARLEARVAEIEEDIGSLASMKTEVASIKQKIDDIDNKLDTFINIYSKQLTSNHKLLKFIIILVGMMLSFMAAVLGVHWKP